MKLIVLNTFLLSGLVTSFKFPRTSLPLHSPLVGKRHIDNGRRYPQYSFTTTTTTTTPLLSQVDRQRTRTFVSPVNSHNKIAHEPPKDGKKRIFSRIALTGLALVLMTFVGSGVVTAATTSSSRTHMVAATTKSNILASIFTAPIARLQDSLQSLSSTPLSPVAVLLSYLIDFIEVGLDAASWILNIVLWPILAPLRYLFRHVVTPFFNLILLGIQRGPQECIQLVGASGLQALTSVSVALQAYLQAVSVLILSTLSIVYNFFATIFGNLFNVPGLQYFDAMPASRHLPPDLPTMIPAQGLKLQSRFGLKDMYGRRWKVHTGKRDWSIPFWERVVMESQLARYQVSFPQSAVKARFGFPEILRGPSPLLGGSLLTLSVIYLLYRAHVKSSIWMRQLQTEAYGKNSWNPVTRLEEEEEKEGGGGTEGEGDDNGKKS